MMSVMSIALANSISTSRHIHTGEYNLRRQVVTPIPQKKVKKKKNSIKNYYSKALNYIKTFNNHRPHQQKE